MKNKQDRALVPEKQVTLFFLIKCSWCGARIEMRVYKICVMVQSETWTSAMRAFSGQMLQASRARFRCLQLDRNCSQLQQVAEYLTSFYFLRLSSDVLLVASTIAHKQLL